MCEAKKVIKRTEVTVRLCLPLSQLEQRAGLIVTASVQVVLAQDVKGLGVRGDITKATYGFFRNYLQVR